VTELLERTGAWRKKRKKKKKKQKKKKEKSVMGKE